MVEHKGFEEIRVHETANKPERIIVSESLRSLRRRGRCSLKGNWKAATLAIVIFVLCIRVVGEILDDLFGIKLGNLLTGNDYAFSELDTYTFSQIQQSLPYSILSMLFLVLVTGAFTLGICMLFLDLSRKKDIHPTDVFLGFRYYGKALGLYLFKLFFVLLWALLFIVPGIIAAIRYSQAYFIMADDPHKGIRQCMNESKEMMKGNKATCFLLELSFIGWLLLAIVPLSIVGGIVSALSMAPIVFILVCIVASLSMSPVMAYMYSTFTIFYHILMGRQSEDGHPALSNY